MLLDVSSRADQMGVTLGPAIAVERDERGDVAAAVDRGALFGVAAGNSGLPLQIMNMDVVDHRPARAGRDAAADLVGAGLEHPAADRRARPTRTTPSP